MTQGLADLFLTRNFLLRSPNVVVSVQQVALVVGANVASTCSVVGSGWGVEASIPATPQAGIPGATTLPAPPVLPWPMLPWASVLQAAAPVGTHSMMLNAGQFAPVHTALAAGLNVFHWLACLAKTAGSVKERVVPAETKPLPVQ